MRGGNEGTARISREFVSYLSRERMIAILGDRRWPQNTKQEEDKICKHVSVEIWKKRRPDVDRSRYDAPNQRRYGADRRMTGGDK